MKRQLVLTAFVISITFFPHFTIAVADGPQWIVTNEGRDDVIYNGDIADDLADYTLYGIRHDSLDYRYNYARRGVLVDVGKVYWSSTQVLDYGSLTDDSSETFLGEQLYIMFIPGSDEGFDSSQYPENCFSQGYHIPWNYFSGSVDTQLNNITLTHMYYDNSWHVLPDGGYYLFRYLHLPTELKAWTGQTVGDDTEKLIITVHGWNESGVFYEDDTDIVRLANAIQNRISTENSDWKFVAYDWKLDADTGSKWSPTPKKLEDPQAKGMDSWPTQNATEAAETAHMHGQNLGRLISEKCPNIKKVHIIAHSAGSWCARTAVKYLIDNTGDDFTVQLTLLDPYMPYQGGADSWLGKQIMEHMTIYENSWKINLLENYYSDDSIYFGTNEVFSWPNLGFNVLLSRSVSGYVYDGHGGPVKFYTDSINGTIAYDPDWNNYNVIVDCPDWEWIPERFGWQTSQMWYERFLSTRHNIDGLNSTDLRDFAILASQWGNGQCDSSQGWCNNADIDMSGSVGLTDLVMLAENWLID